MMLHHHHSWSATLRFVSVVGLLLLLCRSLSSIISRSIRDALTHRRAEVANLDLELVLLLVESDVQERGRDDMGFYELPTGMVWRGEKVFGRFACVTD